jgi:phosphoribosylglycinamide formyltransferase-1
VLQGDDEETLSARILEQEHIAYPEAISRVLSGNYAIVDRRYVVRASQGAALIEETK